MLQWIATIGMLMVEGSYLPQLFRLYKLKEAEEFSVLFPLLNLIGRLALTTYTLTKHDYVLMGGFILGVVLRSILLGQVLYYRWLTRYNKNLNETTVAI